MITRGSGNVCPDKIQQVMGSNGVIRKTEATLQGYALHYQCPADSVHLITTELSQPLFDKEELHRAIKKHAQGVVSAQDNLDIHSVNILKNKLFGTPMPSSDIESLCKITQLQHITKPCKITAAGPRDVMKQLKALHVAGFKEQRPTPLNTTGSYHHTADKTSCAVVWGCAVEPTAVLKVAASILGGGFAGRLMKTVRDKQGLTYGISAGIKDNMFIVKTSFNPTLLQKGISSTEKEIAAWREGVRLEELKTHQEMIVGQRAVLEDDMGKYVDFVHSNKISDAQINAVTLEEINQVVKDLPKLYRVSTGPNEPTVI
jgi:hypothetical protein